MFGSENVKSLTLMIDADPVGDGKLYFLLKAPRQLTVLAAYAVAAASQGAGTAIGFTLLNYAADGTTLQGTAVAQIGGTASAARLTANTPVAGVVDTAQDTFAQGEWLVVRETEEGTGWIANDRFTYVIHYVDGQA